ncbi:unnamed protein product [Nesidiocoris tenuis]|uniref:c-SKI SMAD4-binding domain-containing protein n=1 Tax=Nesidiocoris tenuis TaxID=355587 RepID=A0A6H5GFR9_9HEMI|nr:unnamed protein product [Nesidiocoris tenuis]
METYMGQVYNPHLKKVLKTYQLSAPKSLQGPSSVLTEVTKKEPVAEPSPEPFTTPPPLPIQQLPILTAPDRSPSQRCETTLHGESITCFLVGGEKRLCLPQLLHSILRDFTYAQINQVCDTLQIFCSRCNQEQLEELKETGVLPKSAPSCGLITKTDAERLCSALLHRPVPAPRSLIKTTLGITVYHECFGKCRGVLFPELFIDSDSPCVECLECRSLFSPRQWVCHSHRPPENRTCHWGFDSDNWRNYLLLHRDQPDLEQREKLLDTVKQAHVKNNNIKQPLALRTVWWRRNSTNVFVNITVNPCKSQMNLVVNESIEIVLKSHISSESLPEQLSVCPLVRVTHGMGLFTPKEKPLILPKEHPRHPPPIIRFRRKYQVLSGRFLSVQLIRCLQEKSGGNTSEKTCIRGELASRWLKGRHGIGKEGHEALFPLGRVTNYRSDHYSMVTIDSFQSMLIPTGRFHYLLHEHKAPLMKLGSHFSSKANGISRRWFPMFLEQGELWMIVYAKKLIRAQLSRFCVALPRRRHLLPARRYRREAVRHAPRKVSHFRNSHALSCLKSLSFEYGNPLAYLKRAWAENDCRKVAESILQDLHSRLILPHYNVIAAADLKTEGLRRYLFSARLRRRCSKMIIIFVGENGFIPVLPWRTH